MKTLYVSDLDGTLFNSQKGVSALSVNHINQCVRQGMLFTVATARMPYGCDTRLERLDLHVPSILTNGVFLYDFMRGSYISVEAIPAEAAEKALEVFGRHGSSCFLYVYEAGGIGIFFDNPALESQTQYYSERAKEACREIRVVADLRRQLDGEDRQVVYLALTGDAGTLTPIRDELEAIEGLSVAYYLNIYNNLYCLEAFSAKASKKNALEKLSKLIEYDELVVFGDNLNDLSMIEVADRSYAPANALEIVKEKVTGVLDSNDNDGVAKFLAAEWGIDVE